MEFLKDIKTFFQNISKSKKANWSEQRKTDKELRLNELEQNLQTFIEKYPSVQDNEDWAGSISKARNRIGAAGLIYYRVY
jgi:hypothetical protein